MSTELFLQHLMTNFWYSLITIAGFSVQTGCVTPDILKRFTLTVSSSYLILMLSCEKAGGKHGIIHSECLSS